MVSWALVKGSLLNRGSSADKFHGWFLRCNIYGLTRKVDFADDLVAKDAPVVGSGLLRTISLQKKIQATSREKGGVSSALDGFDLA